MVLRLGLDVAELGAEGVGLLFLGRQLAGNLFQVFAQLHDPLAVFAPPVLHELLDLVLESEDFLGLLAELLAEVFLAMTRGQNTLMIEPDAAPRPQLGADGRVRQRKPLLVRRATAEEIADHERVLAAIDKESKGACIWLPKPEAAA